MKIFRIWDFGRYLLGIIWVYQKAFGGYPWNEGYKCSNESCEAVFPLDSNEDQCPVCIANSRVGKLVEYWPKDQVEADFKSEMGKSGAICVVATDTSSMRCGPDVLGFAWGYDIVASAELDSKLEAPRLSELIAGTFFYLDECAVSPTFQGNGLGKQLVMQIFQEQPHDQVLLRTMDDSRMCRLIKHMGGRTILNISRDRVIMVMKVR